MKDRSLLFGWQTPDDVAEKVLGLLRETGIGHVVFKCGWPGLAHRHTLGAVELLCNEVIPRVKRALGAAM